MARAMSPPSSFHVPPTQNTALVFEFRCLFSTDIKRKQKRWQDGRLKFHTFNKRVLVYDERGGAIGGTHFQPRYDFEEGEELELDNSGTLVQVGECVGSTEQDLTPLIAQRHQDKEKRADARAAAFTGANTPLKTPARPTGPLSLSGASPAPASFQAKPKALNQLLGIPSGHYGRATVPTRSPFEERRLDVEKENVDERPAKRRKPEPPPSRSGYAQNLMGATLTLSNPTSTPTLSRPLIRHRYAASIDLTADEIPPINTQATSHASLESGGIRVTKAQRKDRVIEKSKPERSGYAENLTGVALTLSNTFGKPRTDSQKSQVDNDIFRAPKSRNLQHPVRQETVDPPPPRKVNPFLTDHDGFVEIGSIDTLSIDSRRKKVAREDDELVETEPSAVRPKKTKTAPEKKSRKEPSIRQKTSGLKSSSKPNHTHPSPLPDTPETSNSISRNEDDTSRLAEGDGSTETRLRPLRIRARPPRRMLISAGRSNSCSSVDILRARSFIENPMVLDHTLPDAAMNTDPITLEAANGETIIKDQQSNDSTFGDDPSLGLQETVHDDVPMDLSENQHQSSGLPETRLSETPVRPERQSWRRNEPSSSPAFEGVDYQAIDAFLSKAGNASPYAPKALRQAISQIKSPLVPTNHNERRPDVDSPTVPPRRFNQPPRMKESPNNITGDWSAFSTDPMAPESDDIPQTTLRPENVVVSGTASHNRAQISYQHTDRRSSPKIKESSSALASPASATANPPEPIPSKPKEPKPTVVLPNNTMINSVRNATPIPTSKPQPPPPFPDPPHQPVLPLSIPSKPKLTNPATRGKKAAQKTDAAGKFPILSSIFPHSPAIHMAPLPPQVPRTRVSPRINREKVRVHSAGSVGVSEDGEGAGEEEKGPWCREAFDLFDWRPPGMMGEDEGAAVGS